MVGPIFINIISYGSNGFAVRSGKKRGTPLNGWTRQHYERTLPKSSALNVNVVRCKMATKPSEAGVAFYRRVVPPSESSEREGEGNEFSTHSLHQSAVENCS